MKKAVFVILSLIMTSYLYSQDSIVNYLDAKGNIVKKKKYARTIETLVKKDFIWEQTSYYANGKIKSQGHYETKFKKKPLGQFYEFSISGDLKGSYSYNNENKLEGNSKSWFNNKIINSTGYYSNGNKAGIWKYYHYNGNEACRQYFKNNELLKTIIFDVKGDKVDSELVEFKEPIFKSENESFNEQLSGLHEYLNRYQVVGKIYLHFVIDAEGNIKNVTVEEKIPSGLKHQIKVFVENIKGWQPAVHMNRKIPYNYTVPLNFSVKFND